MTDITAMASSSSLLSIILSTSDQDDGGNSVVVGGTRTNNDCSSNTTNNKVGGGCVDRDISSVPPPPEPLPRCHQSLTSAVQCLSTYELLHEIQILDNYRRDNNGDLYRKVRTLLFLYALHRYHLPIRRLHTRARDCGEKHNDKAKSNTSCTKSTTAFCPMGYAALLDRRFDDAIDYFLASVQQDAMFISSDDHDDSVLDPDTNNDDEDYGEIDGNSKHPAPRYVVPQQISLLSNLNCTSPKMNGHAVMTITATPSGSAPSSRSLDEEENLLSIDGSSSVGKKQRKNPSIGATHTISLTSSQRHPRQCHRLPLPSDATSSALAKAYRELAFQTLAGQVRNSVRSHPGNEWMFRMSDVKEQPLRWSEEILPSQLRHPTQSAESDDSHRTSSVVLIERTPVRMDLCHSCWSDIFFLAMDYPEAARVINCSVDLAVRNSSSNDGGGNSHNHRPTPPIECRLQLTTTNPGTIKLTSVDLQSSVTLTHVSQVFAYGADHLGLLKAGLVASGIVPLGLEERCKSGCSKDDVPLEELLSVMMVPPTKDPVGTNTSSSSESPDGELLQRRCAYGIELTTHVRNIPKGSRLAVSTNLLGSIIAVCMRATRQISSTSGPLLESERRLVAARAILGEWLGGSGGGWQDSGGLWPGLKLICGVLSTEGDPEFGISRGRLLPSHHLLKEDEAPESLLHALEKSLILVHGGMAQNVGPILEMVTEKYLLREEEEWRARHASMEILDDLLLAIRRSDVKAIAKLVTRNFFGPIRTIIPMATNIYTETLIERVQGHFGENFWGFVMCGGMSGGGMGFMFDPTAKDEALTVLESIMLQTKREMEYSLPFAMNPVVFDYNVNEQGTVAELCREGPSCDIDETKHKPANVHESTTHLDDLLDELGFDSNEQEQVRSDLRLGKIGLANNRLSHESELSDVIPSDVIVIDEGSVSDNVRKRGLDALQSGSVGCVTLAAGVGSRWTQGAGVVKALNPFCCIGGKHRCFLDVHLAKNRRVGAEVGMSIPHAITTSWMTDAAISTYVESLDDVNGVFLSKGQSIGLRMIPTLRDLKFLWKEQSHQLLDERSEKVRESVRSALLSWAESNGEGSDYRDNSPAQCLSPVGHWYEFPNLLLSGTLARMIQFRPRLKTLMLHNIDTIGADVDAEILGKFLETESTLAFEVVPRRIEDVGGGLCRVNGRPRLVEGLALPKVDDELKFSYFNSLTTWIDIDKLLSKFGLDRNDILENSRNIPRSINSFSRRLPTYVTIKDVKKRWGTGQVSFTRCKIATFNIIFNSRSNSRSKFDVRLGGCLSCCSV
ncbi:hypothetical protein ACHAWU_009086 [Discostella pseudostelligera]|uniref:UTP--glucose-1-phosphate uridylyltransferase n=1 Tax=Discostella pseudostelligera TaxID=259834 RepID=A0ABD3MJ62_9STRA